MKEPKGLKRGSFLPIILLFSTLFLAYATAIITFAVSNVKIATLHNKKITATSLAEAGINYYMWHLSHNNTDYCDGQSCSGEAPYGPFLHQYKDQSGRVLGTYELYITPPAPGDNVTTVRAIGKVDSKSPSKAIVAEIGMPSFTKYTLMTNKSELWVGEGEKVSGTVHVNGNGMYNEGEITGDASSTVTEYTGWFGLQPGVSGPGIFGGAKLFPVPSVDFNQINVDIAVFQDEAKNQGKGNYHGPSGQKGYHIVLKASNYDLYRVLKYDATGFDIAPGKENFVGTFNYPQTGVVFVEDDLWINGTIENQKATFVAANPKLSGVSGKRIFIPGLVKYTNYDGRDKIGLITQTNIFVTKNAPYNMEIDAAMIAKDGEIKIRQYNIIKGNMKVYGSMAHNTGIVWTYGNPNTGAVGSGYRTTETIIDPQNVLNPPPQFPTTGVFSIQSWREE